MTGDLKDIISRFWAVLPKRWFADENPNLDALLRSLATPWTWLYGLIAYTINQSRVATATDKWLDVIANDYFGNNNQRKVNEGDPAYRARIRAAMLREAATRSAVMNGLDDLLGVPPILFEPANCLDTGSYGSAGLATVVPTTGMAYGQAGGWGNLQLPFQFFVTATRAPTSGIGLLAGYGSPNGGYGGGTISYVDLDLLPGHVSDADVQSALCSLLPINAVAWLRII